MDSIQLATLSILVGLESLPHLKQLVSLDYIKSINWRVLEFYIFPMFFIIIGVARIFGKLTDAWIIWPLFVFLICKTVVKYIW